MHKKNYLLLAFVGVLLAIITVTEVGNNKLINWKPTFASQQTIPYASKGLYTRLGDIFPEARISQNTLSFYEFSKNLKKNNALNKGNSAFFLTTEYLNFDSLETAKLFDFVADGNYAFLSTEAFTGYLSDTLGVRHTPTPFITKNDIDPTKPWIINSDSIGIYFLHKAIPTAHSEFCIAKKEVEYGLKTDTKKPGFTYTPLAKNEFDQTVLLHIKLGSGAIILSSTPRMFTNFVAIYQQKQSFAAIAWSHLPATIENIYWDEYYNGNIIVDETPLRYILSLPAFKWAFYLMLAGILLYMLFEAKRRQRAIPIVVPLSNTTVEFVRTVGLLYYENANHADIAHKKITYLNDFLRTQYWLTNWQNNPEFYDLIAAKTGVNPDIVTPLFEQISQIQQKTKLTNAELTNFNQLIEQFYDQCSTQR